MAVKAVISFLVGMMLLTGVCNTILTKYQDMQCVRNCSSSDPTHRQNFEQPVWQTAQMFVGEMGCWLVVAGVALWRRVVPRKTSSAAGEYEPVGGRSDTVHGTREEMGADNEDDEFLNHGTNPAAKPLVPNDPERRPLKGWRAILLALPACCDIAGTTLMNVGLLFVAASIYQMTRGALVLFVGTFSVIFLGRKLSGYKWFALSVVVAGVAVVGLAGAIEQKQSPLPGKTNPPSAVKSASFPRDLLHTSLHQIRTATAADPAAVQTLTGILLIFLAQIFTASQFVLEESIMHRYSLTPLKVVGWEGTFGLLVTILCQTVLHFAYGRTPAGRGGYFDASTGWREMTSHPAIYVSSLMIMVSIGGFNFFGLSVTRSVSATSRSTIDTCRTLFIWVVSLGLGWESFKWLQVLGFAGLVYGTFLFNDIVRPPRWAWWRQREEGELLPERPVEHM